MVQVSLSSSLQMAQVVQGGQSARGQGCCSKELCDRNLTKLNATSCIWEVTVEAEADQLGSSSAVMALGALGDTKLAPKPSSGLH